MDLNAIVTEPSGRAQPTELVFVHGAWHGAWCWIEHFTEFFADLGYRSYALDLRGHGSSEGSVRSARIGDFVLDVRRVALELSDEPVLIGHSMGGLIVQQYLARYRARGGVLMASVPTIGAIGATLRVIRDHPVAFLRANATLSLGPIVDDPDRAAALLFGPEMDREIADGYTGRLQTESYPAYLEMIADLPRPARVVDPVLVLGAQHDAIFSLSEVRATARAHGTEAVIFDGMGHDMMLEPGWAEPAEVIAGWLAEQSTLA